MTALVLCAIACHRAPSSDSASGFGGDAGHLAAQFDGGSVSSEQVARHAAQLSGPLRVQLDNPQGRAGLAEALAERMLLAQEARRRGLAESAGVREPVRDLEERLLAQAVLQQEEATLPPPTDAELKAYYATHAAVLTTPERIHVKRLLAQTLPGSSAAQIAQAHVRADRWQKQLKRGTPLERLVKESQGGEVARNGDLGWLAKSEIPDATASAEVFALNKPGATSGVLPWGKEGFAVVQLVERRPARTPSFAESKDEIAGRLGPQRKRQAFEMLLARLRRESGLVVEGRAP